MLEDVMESAGDAAAAAAATAAAAAASFNNTGCCCCSGGVSGMMVGNRCRASSRRQVAIPIENDLAKTLLLSSSSSMFSWSF